MASMKMMVWNNPSDLPPNNGKSVLLRLNDNDDLICLGKYCHTENDWIIGNVNISWDWVECFGEGYVVTQWTPLQIPNI
ncbi:hypothetical protein [Aliivibrio salmonicida]|uniref:hypothetical protein n=2 Tax=Aliivibrio salmonicida TaxID=40269 RepID=UPI0030B0B88F